MNKLFCFNFVTPGLQNFKCDKCLRLNHGGCANCKITPQITILRVQWQMNVSKMSLTADTHANESIILLSRQSKCYRLARGNLSSQRAFVSFCSRPILLEARLLPSSSVKTNTLRLTHKATMLESTFMKFESRNKQTNKNVSMIALSKLSKAKLLY